MQTRKEFEFGVMLGKTYWKVLKFVVNKILKDVYLILPIPYAGLHWSIHSPKPPTFPNWRIHVRSREELGIEEKVDLKLSPMFLQESLNDFVDGFIDTFRVCSPTDEEILVMPPSLFNCFAERQMGDKEKTIVDLGKLIRSMSTGTFYRTRTKHLPHLLQEIRQQNPSFSRDTNIFGVSNDKIVIPITSKRMLEFDYRQLTEKLSNMHSVDAFFDPMQRAIERLRELRPDLFQGWFPNDLATNFDNFIEPLKLLNPRFIDFPKEL